MFFLLFISENIILFDFIVDKWQVLIYLFKTYFSCLSLLNIEHYIFIP